MKYLVLQVLHYHHHSIGGRVGHVEDYGHDDDGNVIRTKIPLNAEFLAAVITQSVKSEGAQVSNKLWISDI